MHVLVTGGTGYIGSHTVVALLEAGHTVEIIDDLSNSSASVIDALQTITGRRVPLHVFDVQNSARLDQLLGGGTFDAVIHFAGLKSVKESTADPLRYYRVNIGSSLALLQAMHNHGIKNLVFSSTACVYGSSPIPYSESSVAGQGIVNPYGQTKYMVEQMMRDQAAAHPDSQFTILRYFNPVGAHSSGLIGEYPSGVPNNLAPYVMQVASGALPQLQVFGNDYPTVDGTGVRDYIHVDDLARGHLAALEHAQPGVQTFNLGSGRGTSVLQLIHAFERASGRQIPYIIAGRRPGDLPEYYADAGKALRELGWKTEKTIDQACEDMWRWEQHRMDVQKH